MTEDNINMNEYLRMHIDGKRLLHSQRTADEAVRLAIRYGADEHKAYIAGLLHDVGKHVCKNGLQNAVSRYNVSVDAFETDNPELLHGKIGAAMIKADLHIIDEDILSAIRWHTTGRAGMSLLEKIIYMADLIEPGRCFDGIDDIRVLAYKDLDEAMLCSIKQIMEFVKHKGFSLHPSSAEAYEDILKRRNSLT